MVWPGQGTTRFIRDAVAPGGQVADGTGVGASVGLGDADGGAVGAGVSVGVGTAVSVGAAVGVPLALVAATGEAALGFAPLEEPGRTPSITAMSTAPASATSARPAMVR